MTNKYYVYALINDIDGKVFYIGKGTGNRSKQHYLDALNNKIINHPKHEVIQSAIKEGRGITDFIVSNKMSESSAFALEKRLITKLKKHGLTNISSGTADNALKAREYAKSLYVRIKPYDTWVKQIPMYVWDGVFKRREETAKEWYDSISNSLRVLSNGV